MIVGSSAQTTLTIDLTVESDEDLRRRLGRRDTAEGPAVVEATGHQGGAEIVTVTVTGCRLAIWEWLREEWQDEELALDELLVAAQCGRLVELER